MEILLIDSISVQCFDNHSQKSLHSLYTLLPKLETPNYSSCSTNISKPTSTRRVGMSEISSKDRKEQCQGPKHEFFSWTTEKEILHAQETKQWQSSFLSLDTVQNKTRTAATVC